MTSTDTIKKQVSHCTIAVSDWLAGGCNVNDIPRPEMAVLVAFQKEWLKDMEQTAQQGPENLKGLIDRLERQWHRMGELWERCQGKGWPEKECFEFRSLRDEKAPATRAAIAALAEQPAPCKIRMDLPASISSEAIEADKHLKPQPEQPQKQEGKDMSTAHKLWPPYDRSSDFIPSEWLQQPYPQNNDMTELACRYHRETEAYDNTVCTGPVIDGVIYPLNRKELGLININAKRTLKLIGQEAIAKNILPKDLRHEIRRVGLTGAWRSYRVGS